MIDDIASTSKAPPGRNTKDGSFRQLRRFQRVINSDKVFFRYTQVALPVADRMHEIKVEVQPDFLEGQAITEARNA